MSTRALLGVYVNGTLTKTYFHHWDGYLSELGNTLLTFHNIVKHRLNKLDDELWRASQQKRNKVIGARSPIDLIQPLLDAEDDFHDEPDFNEYFCLEYIYRINFVFNPKEKTFKWDSTLDYTKSIAKLPQKWKADSYIPLLFAEGVHYKDEHELRIDPDLTKYYEPLKNFG